MRIKKATYEDKKKVLIIAKELKDWFNADALKNMALDFKLNNLL